ncbi:aldo/keto reductase family protein [Methylocucumis oryzae]|nr:aldo/keto reductase [Methylocucumis oryzae]
MMQDTTLIHHGITMPRFMYGTAWKEQQTEELTYKALKAGFRSIDTANQRKHYYEAGVGHALNTALQQGWLTRSELFLQTKFTFASSQDHRLPYDVTADYATQVQQSFESSLQHLQTDYIDSYVLHGPYSRVGLSTIDWQVWRAMEALWREQRVKLLGVSNISIEQLQLLLERAEVKPAFVQNRCYARRQWDADIRAICAEHQIMYQGFSLLTANSIEMQQPAIVAIAKRLGCHLTQLIFKFALDVNMMPLTGTSNEQHMLADLACFELQLTEDDIQTIEKIALL